MASALLALLCRLNTMVALMNVPPGASMPTLLRLLAGAQEFSGICLRRSEKKVLSAINRNAECVRYHVEEPSKPGKVTVRIKTAAEKIFIVVRVTGLLASVLKISRADDHVESIATKSAIGRCVQCTVPGKGVLV